MPTPVRSRIRAALPPAAGHCSKPKGSGRPLKSLEDTAKKLQPKKKRLPPQKPALLEQTMRDETTLEVKLDCQLAAI